MRFEIAVAEAARLAAEIDDRDLVGIAILDVRSPRFENEGIPGTTMFRQAGGAVR